MCKWLAKNVPQIEKNSATRTLCIGKSTVQVYAYFFACIYFTDGGSFHWWWFISLVVVVVDFTE